jgi:hypothetical protein
MCSGYERIPNEDGSYDLVIHDPDGWHRAIGKYLALKKKALSGKEIRFLRKQIDLTQSELAVLLATTHRRMRMIRNRTLSHRLLQTSQRWSQRGDQDIDHAAKCNLKAPSNDRKRRHPSTKAHSLVCH